MISEWLISIFPIFYDKFKFNFAEYKKGEFENLEDLY